MTGAYPAHSQGVEALAFRLVRESTSLRISQSARAGPGGVCRRCRHRAVPELSLARDDAELHSVRLAQEAFGCSQQSSHIIARFGLRHARLHDRNRYLKRSVPRFADQCSEGVDVPDDDSVITPGATVALAPEQSLGELFGHGLARFIFIAWPQTS